MSDSSLLIGIDDTDVPGSPGTGRLSRRLADYLLSRGLGSIGGVTRHQLLIHPDIPYTSHNSSACIGFDTQVEPSDVLETCKTFLKNHIAPGADSGLCVAARPQISQRVIDFGKMAQDTVLEVERAKTVAYDSDLLIETMGQKGQGIIGAISAVGLRQSGSDGRFIELKGIRQVSGVLSVMEIKQCTDVASVRDVDSVELPDECIVDTQNWLRPRLMGHEAVLVVTRHTATTGAWISVDKRNSRHSKSK